MLSVIVANYNKEKYVMECLDSILDQTFKDLEIVVYDDGSSDGSMAVIEDFAQRHPRTIQVMHDPVNQGVAFARHQAILAARGEYLVTLDSDDFFCNPRKLEKEFALVQKVEKEERKQIMAFSNVMLLKDGEPPCIWGEPGKIRQGMIVCEIISRSCFIPRDFIMRREWYSQAGGYDIRIKIYEDWDLKVRLAMKHEFRFTGDVGTAYRRHGLGLSSVPPREHIHWLKQVFNKNFPLVEPRRRHEIKIEFDRFLADMEIKSAPIATQRK